MKFSLIVATLGRSSEVARLFESLLNQTYKDFEVILVDQNRDHRVFDIYNQYKEQLQIQYIHTDKKGLSHARNLGLKCHLQDVVAFPDDDCWYAKDTLEKVKDAFTHQHADVISGQPLNPDGKLLVRNYLKKSGPVTIQNVWNAAISISIFLKKTVVDKIGLFDNKLGVGSGTIFGSGEETDYIVRALESGFNVQYDANIKIIHPQEVIKKDSKEINRALSYGSGMGYVLAKHHFPFSIKAKALIRPFGGAMIAFAETDFHLMKIRFNTFRGRLRGMRVKF